MLVKVNFQKKTLFGIIFDFETESDRELKFVEKIFFEIELQKKFLQSLDAFSSYSCNTIGSLLKLSLSGFREKIYENRNDFVFSQNYFKKNKHPEYLNLHQKEAVNLIKKNSLNNFKSILLDGITGSGKTRVYMSIIELILKRNKQCVVLVPEIILTNQWIKDFKNEHGFEPEIFHSSLRSEKRGKTWLGVATGKIQLVVGTRSAIFLPFKNLGLVVLDEEHDSSYKQEDGIIVNSRDWAVLLAKKSNCMIILSTATPSVESEYNCVNGKYKKISLKTRVNNTKLPNIEIIDVKEKKLKANSWISEKLKNAIENSLEKKEQVLIFLNKRGYAPIVLCTNCGYSITCPKCDSSLVLHKTIANDSQKLLMCHYCNFTIEFSNICPKCKNEKNIIDLGPGIEKVYEEILKLFPKEKICMLSSDSVKKKKNLEEIIDSINKRKFSIIIGTQIMSKGHHFPNLQTVGILNIDNLLSSMDFRSNEKVYQLITQVSGRSGRENNYGKVLIQTLYPESEVIKMCCSYEKKKFYSYELQKRESRNLPPYKNLISILLENKNPKILKTQSQQTCETVKKISGLEVFGPNPAPIFKLRSKFRYRILLKFDKSFDNKKLLKKNLMALRHNRGTKIRIDVDPYNFL